MQYEQKDVEVASAADVQSTELEKETPQNEFTTQSILVLFGAWAALFCSIGFVNAFGVFQEYYAATLLATKSSSAISWLGSLQIFLSFGGTPISGILMDKYGPRMCVIGASIAMLIAIFMTSLCTKYYQLILAQGILLGGSMSFLMVPVVATVACYFKNHRGLALGITVSGSSIGGVIWPITLHNLFNELGFGWTVRIAGFIMIPLLISACLFIRLPVVMGEHQKPELDPSCLRNPSLIFLAVGLFFVYLGLFSPLFYITPYTVSLGLNTNMAFYMVSITNAASFFGRLLPGILADRYGAYNIMILSVILSAIVCTCWTKAVSIPGIIVLCLAYGFASGSVISLQSACAAQLVKPQQYGVAMGMIMGLLSISGLIGTPINGQLVDAGGYLALSLFSGLAMIVAAIILVFARLRISTQLFVKA